MQPGTFLLAAAALLLAAPAAAFTETPLPAPTAILDSVAWRLLDRVTIEEKEVNGAWIVGKHFAPELAALEGHAFTISGYAIPLSPGEVLTHLILVRDPADCPFCGGGYGPALEVELDLGLRELPEFTPLTVTGRLVLIPDPETMQAYRLEAARVEGGL